MRILTKTLFFLTTVGLFLTSNAQDYSGSFEFDGHLRNYEVYLPDNFEANMPLVVGIHGIGEDIEWFKKYTLLHETADTMGYVIVYPQGIDKSWNAGVVNPNKNFPNTDDVGFISALIDTMKSHWNNIDLARVYCCGYSLGGHMSFRLVGDIGHRIAAIGTVSGTLFGLAETWNIVRPMPIIHMHGDSDILIPYEGEGDRWAAEKVIEYWINKNQCALTPDTFDIPDIVPEDNCTMQKISYTDCSGGSQFIHYKGIGMGHSWPGSVTTFGKEGNKNMDINANVEILNFFKNYGNPLVDLAYGNYLAIDSSYLDPSNDTLFLNAEIINPKGHSTSVYAIINGEETNYRDSIELYDDGMHNDGNEFDNIYCDNKCYSSLEEDFYTVKLFTEDLDESITTKYSGLGYFTTAGPIEIVSFNDSLLSSDRVLLKNFTLHNKGKAKTVEGIRAKITTSDTNVTKLELDTRSFGTLGPGETKNLTYAFSFYIDSTATKFEFDLEISCYNKVYWTESFVVDTKTDILSKRNIPTEFNLEQNYPNPFNPNTKINYSIPERSYVTLKVFDVLGREVEMLVNKEQSVGNYEVEFDASNLTSGIYFYRIQAGDFVDTKKMLLIK